MAPNSAPWASIRFACPGLGGFDVRFRDAFAGVVSSAEMDVQLVLPGLGGSGMVAWIPLIAPADHHLRQGMEDGRVLGGAAVLLLFHPQR
ncbi:hypothetical protein [Paenarthrobacter sp. NEAU-H11]|uniref:hypothetical protein n=1 Tax=Paenarthrobacter sp. NEAU-H11 TaxID=3423924 RepID=UPI003D3377A8